MAQQPLRQLPNIAAFIAFRIFFNARFYYPVFALLFLDFGLTLAQFSISNLLWAAAIVTLEVPSGALADHFGRKKLVVSAALLMMLEMIVLLLAQPHQSPALLIFFALNRLLSGAGEAMASGADEALAYDSLLETGQEHRWSEVLEWQTKLSSVAFFFVMLVGAAVYDPVWINAAARYLGWDLILTRADTLKLPIWLTFATSLLALSAALSLKAPKSEREVSRGGQAPFTKVWEVGRKLLRRSDILAVVLAAVLFDQAARASLTLSAKTFAAYGINEGWFGLIGATMALSGALWAGPARKLAEGKSPATIFRFLVLLSLLGLIGQALSAEPWGVFFVAVLSSVMSLLGFFTSFYLNRLANSQERATLLSFRGLLGNLGFGLISLYFALVSATIRPETASDYRLSLFSLVIYFLVGLLLFLLWRFRTPTPEQSVTNC